MFILFVLIAWLEIIILHGVIIKANNKHYLILSGFYAHDKCITKRVTPDGRLTIYLEFNFNDARTDILQTCVVSRRFVVYCY